MARVTKNIRYIHDYTSQIHSTRRKGTRFHGLINHNERAAKTNKSVTCDDCRYFQHGCSEYIGRYHTTCQEFDWW